MKNGCEKWRDRLREAALTGTPTADLEEHLRACAICSAELGDLQARSERLDALLPMLVQGAEPSANFRAGVLAAAEAAGERNRARPWRAWTLSTAAALVVVILIIGLALQRRAARTIPADELAAAQKLAEWQAPSDGLLLTPGQEILRKMPRLGESYLKVPAKTDEEE
jgi:hypothetical protein